MKLSNRAYDTLKFIALVILPGFSAAYFGLGQIWGFPNVEEVVGTLTVIDTFLGLLLKSLTTPGPDGDLIISTDMVDGSKYLNVVNLNANSMDELSDKKTVQFKVVNQQVSSEQVHLNE